MHQVQLDPIASIAHWPPDDTEESIMGSEYHQNVIDAGRDGLRMVERILGRGRPAPTSGQSGIDGVWHVLSQVPIAGFRRTNGSPYSMYPDVAVVPRPNPRPDRGETLTIATVGVPLLAIEVLSQSTYRADLDEERGKAWSYADAGVEAYIIVDIGREYMPEHVRALRLLGGRWVRWSPTPEGRWESARLGISFAFDGLYLRIYDAAGRLMPLPQEAFEQIAERDEQLAGRDEQLAERDGRLARIGVLLAAGDLEGARRLIALEPEGKQ